MVLVAVGAFAAGMATGVLGAPFNWGGETRALARYWRTASEARAAVEGTRERYTATPGGVAAEVTAYAAAVANTSFGPLATQLIAELERASSQLRQVRGTLPTAAQSYHFLQLDDWREEREVRLALRDAVLARRPDAWTQAAEHEQIWRASVQHQHADTAAWQLAAQLSRI